MITAVMPTYGRKDVVFERGEGNYLYAADGRRYLDFTSGIAVNALGHCHPALVKALTEQGQKLWHTSNLFRIGNGEKLAKRLAENSFADTMFFCNSGAEAIEGGIKLIRKYQFMNGQPKRYKIICFQAAFHGRLLNALAATGNEKYLEGFGPPAPGYKHAPLNNTNVVRDMVDDETAGILVEPIQGEGGIRATTTQFLKDLRAICDEFGLLLFYDEIHTGFGRTGKMWGYDWSGVKPDVAAIAKGMGGGFPIGAFMATEKAAVGMVPGTHGSTYGGNPLATGVANAVLDEILKPGFIDAVREKGEYLKGQLEGLVKKHPKVYVEQRGMGFLQGIQCTPAVPAGDMVNRLQSLGMLVPPAGENVIRVFPALIADKAAIDEGIDILSKAAQSFEARQGRRVGGHGDTETFPRPRPGRSEDASPDPRSRQGDEKGARQRRPRQAVGRQDARHDLREALDPHPRVVRGRHARARRPDDHAGPRRHPARPRRDHRRHRARAQPLRRHHHDAHDGRGETPRDGQVRDRAGDQRPHRQDASLPADGRRDDLRGASRRHPGQGDRLVGRRQQHGDELDPCRRAVRLRAARRLPARAQAAGRRAGVGREVEGPDHHRPRSRGDRARRRLRRHRHLGVDGR